MAAVAFSSGLRRLLLPLVLSVTYGLPGLCQGDRQVQPEAVPAPARQHLEQVYPQREQTRFFREHAADSLRYEATFRTGTGTYALQFDAAGTLIETERELSFTELPEQVQGTISRELQQRYEKTKVLKVEEVVLRGEELYELELKGRSLGHTGFYEVYFDRHGRYLRTELLVVKPIYTLF